MSFVIIHLTDLHMKGKRENNPIFAKKKKLYCVLNSIVNQNDTVLLMVTGDLAFSGNTMEYLECTSFLSEIETHISKILSATVHIALVPGNHDCNFVGDQQVRDILLSSIRKGQSKLSDELFSKISEVQDNFFEFAEKHGVQYKNRALSNFTINTELGKVLVVQINSAWSSSKNEVAGQLLMPNIEKEFENINDYKLVIALVHHPFHWLIPETRNNLILTIRDKIDLLFIGHEHRNDKFSVTGDDWSFIQYNGKELQNSTDPNDSSFSIFLMKEKTKIKQIEYSWNVDEKFYDRISEICNDIDSNRKSSAGRLYPNELTVTKLNDIGATIHHFRVDSVTLNDLFCWPELDMLDTQDDLFTCKTRIVNNIPSSYLNIAFHSLWVVQVAVKQH